MTTIAAKKMAEEIEASLSAAKRKEYEKKEKRRLQKELEELGRERAQALEGFFYDRHHSELKDQFFNTKRNFPEIHGKPQQIAIKGYERTLQQRHQPRDDDTQLRSHVSAYKFRKREQMSKDGQNLKDGTMLADASSNITTTRATVVGPLRPYRVVNISAGTHHVLVVTAKGQVLSMGEGRAGQLGLGRKLEHTAKPTLVRGELKNIFVVQCAAGASHSLVRTRDEWGTDSQGNQITRNHVYSWGDNSRKQLGLGDRHDESKYSTPRLVCNGIGKPTSKAQFEPDRVSCTFLAAGAHHSIALGSGGKMFSWGSNQYGQIGDGGKTKLVSTPKMNVSLRKEWIVDATAGDMHTIAVTEAGDLWTWGRGTEGQLGHGGLEHENLPKWVRSAGERYEHVSAGRFHTLCRMSNGTVRSFGRDNAGMLGTNGTMPFSNPGGMPEFGPLVCTNKFGDGRSGSGNGSDSGSRENESNLLLLPPVSPVKRLASSNSTSPSTIRSSPGKRKKLKTKKDLRRKKSSSMKSPRNSGPTILATPSPVQCLGPSVGLTRHSRTNAILHKAHHGGHGRNYKEEDAYIVQLAAGTQHSVGLTKRGLAYSFGFAGGNGRLGHGDYTNQELPKEITMLKDDAMDADMWTKRSLLERLVELEKHTNPEVLADSAAPKDVDRAKPGNRVSDEMLTQLDELFEQQNAGNFAFEAMRAFRSVDKGGMGEVDWGKIRPALNAMRIPLRHLFNPFSICRVSVDNLCEAVDEEETGFVDETGFIEYLVEKHTSRKRGMPRKKYSQIYRAYKSCRGQLKDLRPNGAGRGTFINALEGQFIDQSLEVGELVSREQCRKMFEYELQLEFNEDGSKLNRAETARDKIPKDAEFVTGDEGQRKEITKKERGKKNWGKLRGAVKATNAFNKLLEECSDSDSSDSDSSDSDDSDDDTVQIALDPMVAKRQALLEKQRKKKNPGKLSKKELRRLEEMIAQPELLYGCLDLRNLGLTDKHAMALARALRSVPAVKEIDLRLNYISDQGIEYFLDTMNFHNELTEYDSSQTLCGQCGEVLGFAQPERQAVQCLDCGNTQWRPAFLLTKVIVKEELVHMTPTRTFKWYEVDYDAQACQVLADRLTKERTVSLTRHQYAELHEKILEEHVDRYSLDSAEMIERMMPMRKALKKKKYMKERRRLEEEAADLEQAFQTYGRRMFEGKHVPRYGLVSVTQLMPDSCLIRATMINAVFDFFHAHVPLENDRLLEGVQAAHDAACRSVDNILWDCREMKVRIYEILYALAGELYEHYIILNAGATVCQVTSSHNATYLLTREGTVVSMGSINNILDSFKEQIVTQLPDNFRSAIEQGRAEKRNAASKTKSDAKKRGGNDGLTGTSPLQLPFKPWSAFDEKDMDERFAPPKKVGEEGYVDVDAVDHEDWRQQRYHGGLHHVDHENGGVMVEDHDESVADDERAVSDKESELGSLLDSIQSSLSTVGKGEEEEKEEKAVEIVAQAFVGNHYMQGRRRHKTAMELTVDMRERAKVLVAEQMDIIAASLGQDKVKEYKRIATEMQDRKHLDEAKKALIMRDVMWNLDDILMADAHKRRQERERIKMQRMSKAEKRAQQIANSRTGGFEPENLEDLFTIYSGANKRFVQAMYEANGEREGMEKTVGILADLQDQGVFDPNWNPDEDADVIAARSQTGLYSVSNFDV